MVAEVGVFPTIRLTCELAYSKRPPIGANIIPTMKKRGRTVLGVRIGLRIIVQLIDVHVSSDLEPPKGLRNTHCHAFKRC